MLAAPLLFAAMQAIARHYARRARARAGGGRRRAARPHPRRRPGLQLLAPTLRALAFAQATSPGVAARRERHRRRRATTRWPAEWLERGLPIQLVVIDSPFRETVRPLLRYVRQLRREHPGDVISIIIPEYVVGHWWENLLHNQTALRLKGAAAVRAVGDGHERPVGARRAARVEHSADEHQQPVVHVRARI